MGVSLMSVLFYNGNHPLPRYLVGFGLAHPKWPPVRVLIFIGVSFD